ncbi:MAG: NifU family protein [Candidatus Izimaplasma sp.]|nr:NifU family protein [Candidatus Izimaplasma bacterium]
MTTEEKIIDILNKTRSYLQQDGGDLTFVKFEDGIVYIRLSGACVGCGSVNVTLYDGIENILMAEVPDVIGVEQIQ